MIIVLKDNPDQKQLENLVSWLKSMGLDIHMLSLIHISFI